MFVPMDIDERRENPLIAPENVSDTIYFPLFVAAGSDFEFSVPCIKHAGTPSPNLLLAHVESSSELSNIVNIAPNTSSDSVTAHSMAIGDPVRSLRSVLKRFGLLPPLVLNKLRFFLVLNQVAEL